MLARSSSLDSGFGATPLPLDSSVFVALFRGRCGPCDKGARRLLKASAWIWVPVGFESFRGGLILSGLLKWLMVAERRELDGKDVDSELSWRREG
jgi:hypothetical protein